MSRSSMFFVADVASVVDHAEACLSEWGWHEERLASALRAAADKLRERAVEIEAEPPAAQQAEEEA